MGKGFLSVEGHSDGAFEGRFERSFQAQKPLWLKGAAGDSFTTTNETINAKLEA
jgi:hypothetical protein